MRILGLGESCDLGALYLRMLAEGHELKLYIADTKCAATFDGLLPKTLDWTSELDWVGQTGLIVFESVLGGAGEIQDDLRAKGYRVIGGCATGDRLENDRPFAQRVLADHGLRTLPHWDFATPSKALAFAIGHPSRMVLKFNGYGSMTSFIGQRDDGMDVVAMLSHLDARGSKEPKIVLSPYVSGVEMGVGAYFTGQRFMMPACLDWEHKKFFNGNLGELTPEMGTVVTYDRTRHFFDLTLGRLTDFLRREGYQGYINLNTIVNEDGIWPLEFTCRFGYPGFAILERLQRTSWSSLFEGMLNNADSFDTAPGFAVGVVITTPPFPYTREQVPEPVNVPVGFKRPLSPEEELGIHYGEVRSVRGQLLTSGMYGWTMVVTGTGASIAEAQRHAYALAQEVVIPNARYRTDIGDRLRDCDLATVERLGMVR